MKVASFKGVIGSAYGKALDSELKFNGTYEELEKGDEIPSKESLSEDDIRDVVNTRRKASAVQAARTEVLDKAGIKPPTNEDPATALSNMVKILVAQGKSQDEALSLAKTVLGQ